MDRREIARLRARRAVSRATRNRRAVARSMNRARFVASVVVLVLFLGVLALALSGVL